MLCLGPKKSLSSPRLKLTTQGMGQRTKDQSQVWYHSAIQGPQDLYLLLFFYYCAHFVQFDISSKLQYEAASDDIYFTYKIFNNILAGR